jgi:integrase
LRAKKKLTFGQVNRAKIEEFIDFIANYKSKKVDKLAANSQKSMIRCFQAVLNEAWKDEIISFNPNHAIEMPKGEQKQKQFLTLPELQTLYNADCKNDTVKRISLFSALTWLRHSDCVGLRWENITGGEKPNVKFTQQKTKGTVYLPISTEALELCGNRQNESDKVFTGVDNSQFCNTIIAEWVKKAGITKDITFHCFRHTFATLQLTNGTDIYTVSKMLGHADVKTTQIYAQIVNEKRQAVLAAEASKRAEAQAAAEAATKTAEAELTAEENEQPAAEVSDVASAEKIEEIEVVPHMEKLPSEEEIETSETE